MSCIVASGLTRRSWPRERKGLEWAKAGESERQLRDVREMISVHGDELDRTYIERWVPELELEALWQRVQ
jgi:hypothetical protein